MKIARHAQNRLGMGLAEHQRVRQSRQHRAQVKSAIESAGRFRLVETRVPKWDFLRSHLPCRMAW